MNLQQLKTTLRQLENEKLTINTKLYQGNSRYGYTDKDKGMNVKRTKRKIAIVKQKINELTKF